MKYVTKKTIFAAMLFVTIAISMEIIAFQMVTNGKSIGYVNTTNYSAKVETWREQTFWDQFWGTGIVQTSTLYTINPDRALTNTVYDNWKTVLSTSNKTSWAQTANYSVSETKGHAVTADVSAKAGHFEAALGYKFNYSKTTSYSATLNIPAKKSVVLRSADTRIKTHYSTYTAQPQKCKSLFDGTWVNNGSATVNRPLVKEYSCVHLEWSYKNI